MPSTEPCGADSKADILSRLLETKGKCFGDECRAFQKNSAVEN